MRKLTAFVLLLPAFAAAQGTLSIGFYRYDNNVNEKFYPGYSYVWLLKSAKWGFDATCTPALNTCSSPDYTPDGTELLWPEPIQPEDSFPRLGGLDTANYGGSRPQYRAVNIGTNGNATNTWNLFQCACTVAGGVCAATASVETTAGNFQTCGAYNYGGTNTPVQVAMTGSPVTVHFYIGSGGTTQPGPYYKARLPGWPAGVTDASFVHFAGSSTSYACMTQTEYPVPAAGTVWLGNPSYLNCVKITLPANTVPGTYPVGWTLCADPAGTIGCKDLEVDITVLAPPTMELTPPATIPAMPTWYDQPTACLNMLNDTPFAGTDCSMKHILTTSNDPSIERGSAFFCNYSDPSSGLETLAALSGGPRMIDITGYPSNGTSNCSIGAHTGFSGGLVPGCLGFFYDTARTQFQLARWFNSPTQENCARAMLNRTTHFGPIMPGFEPNIYSQGAASGAIQLVGALGSYQCPNAIAYTNAYSNCALGLRGYPTIHNLVMVGTELALSRWNGGNYSSSWTRSQFQPAMRNELLNDAFYLGWWTQAGGFVGPGGLFINDGRATGYPMVLVQSIAAMGEPLTRTTGSTGNRVNSLTGFGKQYNNMLAALMTSLQWWAQPDNTRTATNKNIGKAGAQPWQITMATLDAAVRFWERSHNPGLAATITDLLTYMQPLYYVGVGVGYGYHGMPGSSDKKVGPWCMGAPGEAPGTPQWYLNSGAPLGNCATPNYWTFGLMYGWIYAWHWRHWGNDSFRASSDQMVHDAIVYGYLATGSPFSGPRDSVKNFNENQRHALQWMSSRSGY
jgi:hypothetical protein